MILGRIVLTRYPGSDPGSMEQLRERQRRKCRLYHALEEAKAQAVIAGECDLACALQECINRVREF